ncbi:MAG: DUF3558 domain-containing protein [Pseudonocardiaceae bacterium]
MLTIAACARTEAGSPVTANGGTPSSDATMSFENARDLAAVADDPCALLTPQQLEAISPGLQTSTEGTPWGQTDCSWENDELSFNVAPDTLTGQTIERLREFPELVPVEVAGGYPGAEEPATDDSVCGLYVAVDESEILILSFFRRSSEHPEHKMPCEFLKSITAMMVENIPPKS